MAAIIQVMPCPLCENYAPQQLIHTQACTNGRETFLEERRFELSGAYYYVAVCGTCKGVNLYWSGPENKLDDRDFHKAELIWPKRPTRHESVPDNIAETYFDALRVKDVPNSFANQIGLALEQICDQRKIKRGKLQERLSQLAAQFELKKEIEAIVDALRLLRNKGVHEPKGVKEEYVSLIEEFFLALVDYVYIAPYESRKMLEKLEEMRQKAEAMKTILSQKRASQSASQDG